MKRHGQRFAERTEVSGQALGKNERALGVDRHQLGESTLAALADTDVLEAVGPVAERQPGDEITDLESRPPRGTPRHHFTGELVTGHDGPGQQFGHRHEAGEHLVHVQVATADPGVERRHQHLVGGRRGVGQLDHIQICPVEDYCPHAPSPSD